MFSHKSLISYFQLCLILSKGRKDVPFVQGIRFTGSAATLRQKVNIKINNIHLGTKKPAKGISRLQINTFLRCKHLIPLAFLQTH